MGDRVQLEQLIGVVRQNAEAHRRGCARRRTSSCGRSDSNNDERSNAMKRLLIWRCSLQAAAPLHPDAYEINLVDPSASRAMRWSHGTTRSAIATSIESRSGDGASGRCVRRRRAHTARQDRSIPTGSSTSPGIRGRARCLREDASGRRTSGRHRSRNLAAIDAALDRLHGSSRSSSILNLYPRR